MLEPAAYTLHLVFEAELELFVVFVDNECCDAVEVNRRAVDMIEQTPRSGHDDVRGHTQRRLFLAKRMSAIERQRLVAARRPGYYTRNLKHEFARWGQHEGPDATAGLS